MEYFVKLGEKVLQQLEPDQDEYIILNTAVVYAKRSRLVFEITKTLQDSTDNV